MRKNRLIALIGTLTMAAAGLAAVSVGVSSKKAESVSAANNDRFTILFSTSSWWPNDNVQIRATFSPSPLTFSQDSDVQKRENCNNWNEQTINGTTYYFVTASVDKNNFTYDNFLFERLAGGSAVNNSGWILSPSKVKNGECNAIMVDGSNNFSHASCNYWKVKLHDGANNANVKGYIVPQNGAYYPSAATVDGYSFAGWYTDSSFTNAWASSNWVIKDIDLYAKYDEIKYQVHNYTVQPNVITPMTKSGNTYSAQNVHFNLNDTFKVEKVVGSTVTEWYGYSDLAGGSSTARNYGQIYQSSSDDNMLACINGNFTVEFHTDWTDKINIPKIDFTITYKDQGGANFSGTHETGYPTTHTYNGDSSTAGTTLKSASKDGYKFDGWFTNSACSGTKVTVLGPDEYKDNITLYAKWTEDDTPVTMTFNTNGGTSISPISGKSGTSYTKPADPTKANCTFVKWNPTLPDTLPNENTTYNAEWKINSGTYIAVHNGTDNMEQNGKYVLSLQFEGSTLYATSLTLKKGDYFRVYYVDDNGNASWEGASCTVDFHPDYPAEIINNDVNVKGEGSYTYTVYFDTTSKKYELVKDGNVRNGRYIVVNHTDGTQTLVRAEPWSGYSTYTEYKAVRSIIEGDCIKAMYQDNTQSTIYPLTLGESVKIWEPSDNGLKCPQGDPGLYSFYLISNDGANYSTVSIFKEGEDTAITYAKFFLKEVAKICDLDGHTDPSDFKPVWSPILEAKYNELGITKTNPAGLLLIDADETYENEDLKKFAYMYDYIYGKYHTYFDDLDFVGRNPTDLASGSRLISINNVSTSTWIIATVAIVGIAAVGVFFIYRKRKEN